MIGLKIWLWWKDQSLTLGTKCDNDEMMITKIDKGYNFDNSNDAKPKLWLRYWLNN